MLLLLSLCVELVMGVEPSAQPMSRADSIAMRVEQSVAISPDSLARRDTTSRTRSGGAQRMLDDIMKGANKDSLYYDVRAQQVHIYDEGDVQYQNKSLKADYMRIDMNKNEIFAYGRTDTVNNEIVTTKPEFVDGGMPYVMDTITYNLKTSKAKIKGVATQEGEGWLVGSHVKKMPDNSIHIKGGKYTTCDCTDHPHFYLAMTKAKVIPGNKVVTGPAYFVMEDVPLYILGIPEGFFPISSGPKSGLLMPSYGEDGTKGFFLRDLGYYFNFNDYIDLALETSIYSLGSWDVAASSNYVKRYKYDGRFDITYSNIKSGDFGDSDFIKSNSTSVKWTHSQDPKANPGSTFSASVNFATSGYSKYSATNLNDMLQSQTNSSISYSKSWSKVSFSTNMAISQNSQTEAISVTFPTAVVSVSRFYPFKRKEAMGEQRWWEKISMSYTGKMTNSVTAKESDFFTNKTLDNMKNGIEHTVPVSASFNLFNYINLTPSFNYNEKWYIKSEEQKWDPVENKLVSSGSKYGFHRLYNYSTSASASTTVYGMFQAKKKTNPVQAIRHTITPSVGMSYTPDFSQHKYGYYQTIQKDSVGNTMTYSPYTNNAYGVPSSGKNMSMTFSLSQTLAMKVLSDRDTTGVRKIDLIDEVKLSGSYNFLADSMKLSTIPVSFRTTLFGNFGLNLSLTLDPYKVTPEGVRYDELFFPGRITNTGWSFGYTFKSRSNKSGVAINDITSIPPEYTNPFYDPYGELDPNLRRMYMAQSYYDFSLPWNVGFNYVVSYSINYTNNGTTGYKKNVTQSVGFNGSLTVTPKTGVTFSGGYDIKNRKLTTSSVAITRDLHCWQMSFSWIPFGYYKSWDFSIGVKSAALADLKYEKSQSMYDNLY